MFGVSNETGPREKGNFAIIPELTWDPRRRRYILAVSPTGKIEVNQVIWHGKPERMTLKNARKQVKNRIDGKPLFFCGCCYD